MSLDDDQYEDLRPLVERSKDDGFKMDFLQFRKLMNVGNIIVTFNVMMYLAPKYAQETY